jgi:hypothetical protein
MALFIRVYSFAVRPFPFVEFLHKAPGRGFEIEDARERPVPAEEGSSTIAE